MKKQINVALDQETRDQITRIAKESGLSEGGVARWLIRTGLEIVRNDGLKVAQPKDGGEGKDER